MLTELTLNNFQCHERITLEFDPLVTTVCGRSDAGKSSLLRALRWAALNRPFGVDFIRHGSGTTFVRLRVDGHDVKRVRGGKRNEVLLDGKSFVALKQGGVPEQVAQLFNLSEVNFQRQLEPHWWFCRTPGELAKELNRIVNLSLIDKTAANLAARLRQARAEEQVIQSRLKEARRQRDTLAWAPGALEKMEDLAKQFESVQETRQKTLRIAALAKKAAEADRACRNAAERKNEAVLLIQAGEKIERTRQRVRRIQQLVDQVSEHSEDVCRLRKEADALRKDIARTKTCPLCGSPNWPPS